MEVSDGMIFSPFSPRSRNILDDFREAYFWLRQNTPEDARVMSWWDYGYQIAGGWRWDRREGGRRRWG